MTEGRSTVGGFVSCLISLLLAISLFTGGPAENDSEPSFAVRVNTPVRLRVMTFNIRSGRAEDDTINLEAVVQAVKDTKADLVGLQEVDRFMTRSGTEDQIDLLAKRLGMYYAYGANLSLPQLSLGNPVGHYGNAVLSRYPIIEADNVILRRRGTWENRGLLRATVDVDGFPIHFYVTHLGLAEGERLSHAEQILDVMARQSGRKILVGDFNSRPHSTVVRTIEEYFCDVGRETGVMKATFHGEGQSAKIDYVFIEPGVEVASSTVMPVPVSDHSPLIADLIFYPDKVKMR